MSSRARAQTPLFSTHPGTADRISRIKSEAARMPPRAPTSSARHPGWAELKARYPTPKA